MERTLVCLYDVIEFMCGTSISEARRRSIAHLVYSENFVSPRARSSRSSYEAERLVRGCIRVGKDKVRRKI